jgi:hypothetical protein
MHGIERPDHDGKWHGGTIEDGSSDFDDLARGQDREQDLAAANESELIQHSQDPETVDGSQAFGFDEDAANGLVDLAPQRLGSRLVQNPIQNDEESR